MKTVRRLNAPVLAFFLVLVGGWGLYLYYGDWWWLAGAILLGLIVGDFVEALVREPDSEKPKRNGVNKS